MATFKFFHPEYGYQAIGDGTLIALERTKIQVTGLTQNSAHTITLKVGNTTIFTRTFYPLNTVIELDIHDDIAQQLSITNMNGDFGQQPFSWARCVITCTSGRTVTATKSFAAYLAENGQEGYDSPLTDIDYLNITRDTVLRLSVPNIAGHYQEDDTMDIDLYVKNHRGVNFVKTFSFLVPAESEGLLYGLVPVSELPVRDGEPFQILYGNYQGFTPAPSAIFRVVPGKAEQFAFLNRHGAVDVVPMFGELSLATDFAFKTGNSESIRFRIDAQADKAYSQNTGNITRKAMDTMAGLLTSRQAWHCIGGVWHEIIIEEADTIISSSDTLHSCTFKFRYADKKISNNKI